jgi:hypothetical protein
LFKEEPALRERRYRRKLVATLALFHPWVLHGREKPTVRKALTVATRLGWGFIANDVACAGH